MDPNSDPTVRKLAAVGHLGSSIPHGRVVAATNSLRREDMTV